VQLRHARAFSVRKACGRRRGTGNGFDGRAGVAAVDAAAISRMS